MKLGRDHLAIELQNLAIEFLETFAHLLMGIAGMAREHRMLAHELLSSRTVEGRVDGLGHTGIAQAFGGPAAYKITQAEIGGFHLDREQRDLFFECVGGLVLRADIFPAVRGSELHQADRPPTPRAAT